MSRTLRIVTVIVAALLLTSFFVYLGFPYDRLGDYLSEQVEQATGTRLTLGRLDSKLFLQGPGFVAEDVTARTTEGDVWNFDRLAARPAWSLSWFQGRPAFFVDVAAPFGAVEGIAVVAKPYAFDGEATNVDLAGLPLEGFLPDLLIEGRADIVADLVIEEAGPRGPLEFTARDGTIGVPDFPIPVPFDQIVGDLTFGGEHAVKINTFDIQSSMGSGKILGSIGQSPVPANAVLDLQLELKAEESIQPTFQGMGVKLGKDGTFSKKITGTVSRPLLR